MKTYNAPRTNAHNMQPENLIAMSAYNTVGNKEMLIREQEHERHHGFGNELWEDMK